MRLLTRLTDRAAQRWSVAAGVMMLASCGDSPAAPPLASPARVALVAGAGQSALANQEISAPIRLMVQDAAGRPVARVPVAFAVVEGDGALLDTAARESDSQGFVTAPPWRLGRRVVPQTLRASVGTVALDVSATVTTSFDLAVRFFGEPIAPVHRDIITAAVARVRAIIVGDLRPVNAVNSGIDLSDCRVSGQPALSEVIDDVLVFASVPSIDGPGRILAQAGPCLVRTGDRPMTAVGVMMFDAADVDRLLPDDGFEQVVTHEILHVLGFGTLWPEHRLIRDTAAGDPRFTGLFGHHGCATTWLSSCTPDIPVEAGGGPGTALTHWRETVFRNELLTGYYSPGRNVLTPMTIGSLDDLGFVVNMAAADEERLAALSLGASASASARSDPWERQWRPIAAVTPEGVRHARP